MGVTGAARAAVRFIGFFAIVAVAVVEYALRVARLPAEKKREMGADWLHRWSWPILRLFSIHVTVRGTPPPAGLLASNHLSYMDIFVLSAVARCVFVSKAEIADWPVFGFCARLNGTIFVDRSRRGAVAPVAEEMRKMLAAGVPVVLFPEGTSTNGKELLPFKPALFAPTVEIGCPVTAVALDFHLPDGNAADEVCFWGDTPLLGHALNLFSKKHIYAQVTFGSPSVRTADRKALARELHGEVAQLIAATRSRG